VFVLGIAGMIFHESQSIVPSSTIQIYRTRPGQRMTARLLDGSTMVLAPASSAAVTARGIDVIGEAYFAVVPHTAHPFVVRTQNATMQVLGTRFSVRQYPEEFQSRVVVDDGRVAVSLRRASQNGNAHTGNAHTVVASRMLAVISDSSVSVSSEITSRDYTSWTHGILVFDHVALRDVVTELARAYGVPITIPDTILAAKSVGIEVSVTNDPLSLVLETLCGVVDAHYVRAAHSYVLSPGRVPSKSRSTVFPRYSLPQPEQQYGK
jgi:ferric-dicitrate binding protein FerR (iron transport regulator)